HHRFDTVWEKTGDTVSFADAGRLQGAGEPCAKVTQFTVAQTPPTAIFPMLDDRDRIGLPAQQILRKVEPCSFEPGAGKTVLGQYPRRVVVAPHLVVLPKRFPEGSFVVDGPALQRFILSRHPGPALPEVIHEVPERGFLHALARWCPDRTLVCGHDAAPWFSLLRIQAIAARPIAAARL